MTKQLTDKQLFVIHGMQPFSWLYWAFRNDLCKGKRLNYLETGYVKWYDIFNKETKSLPKMEYIQYTEKFVEEVFNQSM